MPSLAKHHLLRAYLPLMVPFRTRFSRHEVVHVAYVQRLMGYLYTGLMKISDMETRFALGKGVIFVPVHVPS